MRNHMKNLSKIKINITKSLDSISNLTDGWNSLLRKIRVNEIIIKPTDKGTIVCKIPIKEVQIEWVQNSHLFDKGDASISHHSNLTK